MKLLTILLLVIPGLSLASPMCEEGNALPPAQISEVETLHIKWLEHAVYCDFGIYQVLAPKNSHSDAIIIFKHGKVFMLNQSGYGINLFQSYAGNKPIPYLTVQDWDNNGVYERLDYSLVDKKGREVGDVQDKDMSGQVHVFKYKK